MNELGDDFNMEMDAPQLTEPTEQSNRTFIIVAGVLAGAMVLLGVTWLKRMRASI